MQQKEEEDKREEQRASSEDSSEGRGRKERKQTNILFVPNLGALLTAASALLLDRRRQGNGLAGGLRGCNKTRNKQKQHMSDCSRKMPNDCMQ
jgi:hypothetical protein